MSDTTHWNPSLGGDQDPDIPLGTDTDPSTNSVDIPTFQLPSTLVDSKEDAPPPSNLIMPSVPTDIGGDQDSRDDITPIPTASTTPDKASKAVFVREPYNLRTRIATALPINEHVYKLPVRAALDTHGATALTAMITECNNLINKTTFHPAHTFHRVSPTELLTGRKTSYLRDLRIGFMDYAQFLEPVNDTTYNTMKPHTRGGVALFPLRNSKGSVRFMTLDTGLEVYREKFHLLPMPDVVIQYLNALAAKDKKTVPRDPSFQYHGRDI